MTKKDVLIFLNIYILSLKGVISKVVIDDFKDDVCSKLMSVNTFEEFLFKFDSDRLYSANSNIRKGFSDYLHRIFRVLDINF